MYVLNTVSEYNCVAFNSKGILAFFPRLFLKNIFGHCTRVILFSNSNSFLSSLIIFRLNVAPYSMVQSRLCILQFFYWFAINISAK